MVKREYCEVVCVKFPQDRHRNVKCVHHIGPDLLLLDANALKTASQAVLRARLLWTPCLSASSATARVVHSPPQISHAENVWWRARLTSIGQRAIIPVLFFLNLLAGSN